LFLFVAIGRAERLPGGLARYGLGLGGVLAPASEESVAPGPLGQARDLARALWRAVPSFMRELGFALALCAVVFPPFVVAFRVWHAPEHPFQFLPPADLIGAVATQVLVVALPEEALFRGYVQGRLHDAFAARTRWLGVDLAPTALLLQAVLFAVIHFAMDLQVVRLAVFFPGLLFGWVALRRGGIGAAIFVHAASNLLSEVLMRGWL
jgi:uncharacterized protein